MQARLLAATGARPGFRTEPADWVFLLSATAVWAVSLLLAVQDFRRLWKGGRRFTPLTVAGAIGTFAGVYVRRRARTTLGERYTYGLRIVRGHQLVTTGIYKYIRHPGYAGTLLADISIPLILSSLRGAMVALLLVPCILYRIHVEECLLVRQFGKSYLCYMRHTRRLIPFVV